MLGRDALAPARELLQRHFGYQEFRPLQARVLDALQQGHDVLAVLPTGGGKSVCFQIPALLQRGVTVVVSPLISLMQDQVAAARARGLPAAALNSSLSLPAQREVLAQTAGGKLRLLYTSPERLRRLADDLNGLGVRPELLAIDEAHCISDWGPDFRPAYRALRRLRALLGWPQVIALTGSATPDVRRDVIRVLGLGGARGIRTVLGSFDRRNLWLGVASVENERERLGALLTLLGMQDALAIVYAPTRNLVEELARVLGESGFRAAPYHAGLSSPSRRQVLQRFLADELGIVVATCAFGMGIDKPNVRLVVHWTLPATPEAYYQEAGRAGRDGAFARCVLLYRRGDAAVPRRQLDVTFPPEQLAEQVWRGELDPARVPANLRGSLERLRRELHPERGAPCWTTVRERRHAAESRITVMEQYAQRRACRRAALLGYFGEPVPRCSGCDVCSRHGPAPLPRPEAEQRLTRLRMALTSRLGPWGGCVFEPAVLRRLANDPPVSESALAAVDGVGPVLAKRYAGTVLAALGALRSAPASASS
ncbi:MAG TPA: RecQ family ATP-dependent DNA helicase [Gemmatimonadales bacterium]|jgi:ATP-dependent DNA helicase RecQ|nr:RecQ family ATP-dependent DNA helicase [Gemmatimonadales bacterium]